MLSDNVFGVYNLIINYNNFVGVLRISTVRKQEGLVLQFDLHKFLKSNQFVLDNIINQNNTNPTDSKLLDRVSTEKINTLDVNYIGAKQLCEYTKGTIKWANETGTANINFVILGKMQAILDVPQLQQIYHVVDTFGKNYFLLENIYNMVHNRDITVPNESLEQHKSDKVTNYVQRDNVCDPSLEDCIQQQKSNMPKDDFEILFEYCCNPNIRNLAIHYALNYYQYVSAETVSIDINENIINVKTPNILPFALNMDKDFFYDNMVSSNSIPLSTITTYAGKLIRKVIFEDLEKYSKHPIYLMMFNLIMLVYSIRYLVELYANTFDTKFEAILSNEDDFQQRIIKHYSNSFLKENIAPHENGNVYEFNFEITKFNLYDQWDIKEDEVISKISEKESHIIPVSHEVFIENVFKRLDEDEVEDKPSFRLSNKKIIDLTRLIKQDQQIRPSTFIDPDNELDPIYNEELDLTNYLRYIKDDNNMITTAFKHINKYSQEPSSVSFIKNFPKEILNLFPVISKDILVPEKLSENLDSTFDYYKIVIDNLPRPETIRFSSVLFIVFQIIIPYYYYFYKKTHFNDCFL